jgi:D-sedoheptulose 7-phosphate isomerase
MAAFRQSVTVRLAALGEDVVPVGALSLAESIDSKDEVRSFSTGNRRIATVAGSPQWIASYLSRQCETIAALPVQEIADLAQLLRRSAEEGRNIFIIGNGGNAANSAHFATDLGKGASDRFSSRFRIHSLAENVSWLTALGNDYSYDDAFVRQLMNFAEPGDILIASSVSGGSPNLIKAVEWANSLGMETVVLLGSGRGKLAGIARRAIVVQDTHYGRVEDAQMTILHLLAYAFIDAHSAAGPPHP